MANNFCSNCGASLSQGSKFCRNCGAKIEADSSKSQNEPGDSLSNLQLTIPASFKKGLVVQKSCTLVFTDNRMIVALTDRKMMNDHIASVREEAKGQGFMKKTAAVMKAGYSFSDRYYKMSVDNIIAESPDNFSIGYDSVQSARYKRGTTSYGADDTSTSTPPSLTLKTTTGKLVFLFTTGYRSKELIALLNRVFAGRYKGPKR